MDEKEYITEEKKTALEAELKELTGPKRKSILESLEFAKSLGDLSENAEYHQAREEQSKLEDRIQKIQAILKSPVVIKKHHSNTVDLGSTVTVMKKGESAKKVFTIVGSEETDMAAGKISNRSPLGEALVGKKKGETATFSTPKGTIEYSILDIE